MAVDALTDVVEKMGSSLEGFIAKVRASTAASSAQGDAELRAAEKTQAAMAVQLKYAEALKLTQAAEAATAKGAEDASLLQLRASKAVQDAKVADLALQQKARAEAESQVSVWSRLGGVAGGAAVAIGAVGLAVGVAAGAIGVVAVKAASDFNQQ